MDHLFPGKHSYLWPYEKLTKKVAGPYTGLPWSRLPKDGPSNRPSGHQGSFTAPHTRDCVEGEVYLSQVAVQDKIGG